jgi:lysozyme
MNRTDLFEAIRPFAPDKRLDVDHVLAIDELADAFGLPRAGGLSPSPKCAAFIKDIERLAKLRADGKVEAYMPTPDDVPTIGYGSTGPDIKMGTVWTVAQCNERFDTQLANFGAKIAGLVAGVPTTQGQYDAMVSLAYNIGVGAFSGSTLLKLHKAGDIAGAAEQFKRWNKQAGKVLGGLTKRRAAEAAMYRGRG